IPCPTCGNRIVEFPETCDTGGPPNACCDATCRTPFCDDFDACTIDACTVPAGCTHARIPGCTTTTTTIPPPTTTTTLPPTTTTTVPATTTTSPTTSTSPTTLVTTTTSSSSTTIPPTTTSTTIAPPSCDARVGLDAVDCRVVEVQKVLFATAAADVGGTKQLTRLETRLQSLRTT